MSTPESSSPRSSPTLEAQQCSPSNYTFTTLEQAYSPSATAVPAQTVSTSQISLDERIYELKSRLTDLLNHEAVRGDDEMRSWCQARLMEAEMELRRQRRGRIGSLSPSIDGSVVFGS